MNHQRQGVIFDVEDQPDILTPLQNNSQINRGPFVAQEESPLQRPRPPEPRKRSFPNRWSHRLSAVILNRSNNFSTRFTCMQFSSFRIWVLWPFYGLLLSNWVLVFISLCKVYLSLALLKLSLFLVFCTLSQLNFSLVMKEIICFSQKNF